MFKFMMNKGVSAGLSAIFAACLSPAFAGSEPEIPAVPVGVGITSLSHAPVSIPCEQPDSRTLSAIVKVATDHGSYASGVVFDDNRVLTAAHAIQGGGRFYVRTGDAFRSADLIMVDHANDLAVLAVNTLAIEPIRISGFGPTEAEPVWAVGYPRAQAMSTSFGVFQRSREGTLHSSAPIDPGQSGGGLLSCHQGSWSLAGMLRGYGAYWQGDHYVKLKNHSVSVAAATINEFLLTYH